MKQLLFIAFILILAPITYSIAIVKYDNSFKSAPVDPNTTTVDILWEAQTTTPSWYKGRALPSADSTITAIAIPNINNIPKSITYKWYKDTKLIKSSSDKNANILKLSAPNTYGDYVLSVELLDPQGRLLARNGSKIKSVTPEIIMYTNDPLLGIKSNSALRASRDRPIILLDTEPTFTAIPFYLSKSQQDTFSYNWDIKNALYEKPSKNSITIINSSGVIDLSIQVLGDKLLQSARSNYVIKTPNNTQLNIQNNNSNVDDSNPFNEVKVQ